MTQRDQERLGQTRRGQERPGEARRDQERPGETRTWSAVGGGGGYVRLMDRLFMTECDPSSSVWGP